MFSFSNNFDIVVNLDGQENRKITEVKIDDGKKKKENQYVYYDGETVSGKVSIEFKKLGKKLDHQGIKIEFIGQIELFNDKSKRHDFTSLVRELANPGELIRNTVFPFEFVQVEKPYETYYGSNVKLSYFLRVTVVKRISDVVKEVPLAVHTLAQYPETNYSITMEVGIDDCLHIEFEYNKSKYYLNDVIVGKIYFILVRLKIKHMDIEIIKRESVGSETDSLVDNERIAMFEIMDGLPAKGESIPIRLFLSGYKLTPTMKDVNKKFSVRYYINLVLVDEEDRRYFKQQEITLFRKMERQKRVAINKTMGALQQPNITTTNNNNTSDNADIKNSDKYKDTFRGTSENNKNNSNNNYEDATNEKVVSKNNDTIKNINCNNSTENISTEDPSNKPNQSEDNRRVDEADIMNDPSAELITNENETL